MTDEQTVKFRKGQRVKVLMRIEEDGPDRDGHVYLEALHGHDNVLVDEADIVSAEAEPLKAGDYVQGRHGPAGSCWRVVAINGDRVWCVNEYDHHETFYLWHLVRA